MYKPKIRICPEGTIYLIGLGFFSLLLALWGWEWLSFLVFILFVLVLNFFRDPYRVIPQEKDVAVSPADGKVVKIWRDICPFTGEEREVISVFMNIFNVHVNRTPVTGKLKSVRYIPGKFFNASLDKASKDNERNLLHIEDEEKNLWTVVQIAGLIARRIVCFWEIGELLKRGERFGLIKFGSRLDLYLPSSYKPVVNIGDKVLAGESILAKKRTNE
ncbi:MAG: phosphatidylserine decarboxylase family protein [Desulfonauticus sp.]|nr:phosphatidylserine decarboxylase family protein [Desulfonauticus sp.]